MQFGGAMKPQKVDKLEKLHEFIVNVEHHIDGSVHLTLVSADNSVIVLTTCTERHRVISW